MTTSTTESVPTPSSPAGPNICTLDAGAVAWAGEPCASCGHTTLAHPGPANPELVACVICRLLDLALFVGLDLQPWQLDVLARLSDAELRLAQLEGRAS